MSVFICLFEPKKSAQKNGAIPLVIALEAKTQKLASMAAVMKLEEDMPGGSDNFFNPKLVEDRVGGNRPALGRFDENFAQENQLIDGLWQKKTPVVEAPPAVEEDGEAMIDFGKLPIEAKVATMLLFDNQAISQQDLAMVNDFIHDEESNPGLIAIIQALSAIPALAQMYPDSLKSLIADIIAQYPQLPAMAEIKTFAEKWIATPRERPALAGKSNSPAIIAPATLPSDSNIAPIIKGPFKPRTSPQSFDGLDMEIAIALSHDDIDCWGIRGAQIATGKELIAAHDKAYEIWSMEFRLLGKSALAIPREAVFGIINHSKKLPDLMNDLPALRQYLRQAVESVAVISEIDDQPISDQTANDAKTTLTSLGYGVFAVDFDGASAAKANDELPSEENPSDPPTLAVAAMETPANDELTVLSDNDGNETPNDFAFASPADITLRAGEMDEKISHLPATAQNNLGIWRQVQKTDEKFTKAFSQNGGGTSINGIYMMMRATELFGPIGIGWGYSVVEERFDNGAPLVEKLYGDKGTIIGNKVLRDADGRLIFAINHTIKIDFWYQLNGERGHIESFGCTPYIVATKYGPDADGEAPKKSLTDAIKKALSLLGFSADVFLGLYDDPTYRQEVKQEFSLKNASDKAEDIAAARSEFDERLAKNADSISHAVTVNEADKVYKTIARELEIHKQDALAKADNDRAKYLSGRLRRLTEIKESRIAELTAEATA